MPQAYVTHTIIDYSGERSFTRHFLPTVTNANYAVVTGNTPATQNVGSLRVALGAVTDGNFVKHEVTSYSLRSAFPPPTDEEAQRELKLQLHCMDTAVKNFVIEIPCPILSTLAQSGTDEVDIAGIEMAALVAQLEANFVSPWGNTYTVQSARIVGRRL